MSIEKVTYTITEFLNENYLSKNYNASLVLSGVDKEDFKQHIGQNDFMINEVPLSLNTSLYYIEGKYIRMGDILIVAEYGNFDSTIQIQIYGETLKSTIEFYNLFYKNTVEPKLKNKKVTIGFYRLSFNTQGSLTSTYDRMDYENFDNVNDKFYPYLDINLFTKEFFTREENILVLSGKHGTGKTKFSSLLLKKAIENFELVKNNRNKNIVRLDSSEFEDLDEDNLTEIKVAYVKNEDILAEESFWGYLNDQNFDFVILDDLDYMLMPRVREASPEDIKRSKFISQFLSYTDGIIPTHTKFVITSNKITKDIDKALMRDGRMFDILSFRELSYEEAFDIWSSLKLPKDIFEENFKEKEKISHAELGSIISMIKKDKEMKAHSYLKDDSISEMHSARKNKKIGF